MATVADVRCTPEFVESLRCAGLDGVRINSAHVTPDDIRRMVSVIKGVDSGIVILMDTKGPEIRTTENVDGDIRLADGDEVEVVSGNALTDKNRISILVEDLHRYVAAGNEIMLDDGDIRLGVKTVSDGKILATVVKGGVLGSRKTVAIPGVELPPLPAVSDRDRLNIHAAREAGIDIVAHSFVRSVDDVDAVRAELEGSGISLYSKIECREALENFSGIVGASDGILMARGDLGTNIPLEDVPATQYDVLTACRAAGKPTIVATQMLHSMMSSPYPTRAELSDIALAVMEGAGTLLLCGETATGCYPVECVSMMKRTIDSIENHGLRCRIS